MSMIKRYLEDLAVEYHKSHPELNYEEAVNIIIENGGEMPHEDAE